MALIAGQLEPPAPSTDLAPQSYVMRLGSYASRMQAEDLSQDNLQRLEALMLYAFTVALAYHGDADIVQRAMPLVYSAPGKASLISSMFTRSAPDAAAINSALVAARCQNDTHSGIMGHPGCVVIPAVLAIAQECRAAPRDVLAALAAAYEVPAKIGSGCVSSTTARGFRGTSLFGVFGAAAGCARVLGLDTASTAHALALAANFSCGLTQCCEEGTPEAIIQSSQASHAGVRAALLAARGVTAADKTLEGPKGFFNAFGGRVPELSIDGWSISEVVYKTYPGCVINQQPVRTVVELMKREGLRPQDVAELTVALHPENATYPGVDQYGPFSSKDGAIMSAPFMLQVAVEEGKVTMRDLVERFGADPLHERSKSVKVISSNDIAHFMCRIELVASDGCTYTLSSPPASSIAFDAPSVLALCQTIADEWPMTSPGPAFGTLRSTIADYFHCQPDDGLGAIFAATKLQN